MTNYSLSFWFKSDSLERLYVNAADRTSLGYIERRQVERQRGTGSYYDRHRTAHGDTMEVVADRITSTLPAGAYEALIEQAIAASDAAGLSHLSLSTASDEIGAYLGLKNILTGLGYGNDSAKTKKARKALAASFRFGWEAER